MQTPYFKAADFFGRAYLEQGSAADFQEAEDRAGTAPSAANIRLQNPTIGSIPPSLYGAEQGEQDADAFMSGVKESLLEQAKEKKRPTNGHMQLRASGGVNTAVK